jgi:putative ATP-dependent endonuclease of OLD family
MNAPAIYHLAIQRFRGLEDFSWRPNRGMNIILGGGDVGKTTILEAIALLLNPTNSTTISDTDYYGRVTNDDFTIEAIIALPETSKISEQTKPSWPWHWNGQDAVVPNIDTDAGTPNLPVYRLRVRGTAELELLYEIVQPDGTINTLQAGLRRAIGLVRLSGDDRNDRDLRLVQGSALDRLLSDKALRSRLVTELAKKDVKEELTEEAKKILNALDEAFKKKNLPSDLDIAITGGQGLAITALIGLRAKEKGVQLPLTSWGAGTRRLSSLAIAEQKQGEAPITIVDEIERGLEPYRQRALVETLQSRESQVFVTTHSPSAISAGSEAALWYVDANGKIGELAARPISRCRKNDAETFLARLALVAEGATEVGFVSVLLEKCLGAALEQHGIHITDAGGNDAALDILEALSAGGLQFAGFADDEGTYPERWKRVSDRLGTLLFRWKDGAVEKNVISLVPEQMLEDLIRDPLDEKTGTRLRILATRIGIAENDFETLKQKAGGRLKEFIIEAACGTMPNGIDDPKTKKEYQRHAQAWFKSVDGGCELAAKVFSLGIWPSLKPQLMLFCNAIRKAVNLPDIQDIVS